VSNVQVTLSNINHTYPDDIDVLLVGPGGQKAILMSDAGASFVVNGVNLTFSDGSPALPDSSQISTGVYTPTNYAGNDVTDTFPAPAPAGPYGGALSVFSGTNPNGTWSLYVVDDQGGDSGTIASGWCLTLATSLAQPRDINKP
jgi:subtilisin-like proprotein convertase family protein